LTVWLRQEGFRERIERARAATPESTEALSEARLVVLLLRAAAHDWMEALVPRGGPLPRRSRFPPLADLIEAEGYKAKFEGIAYTYLRVDDSSTGPPGPCGVRVRTSNRRPASDVEGQPEHEQTRLPLDC
jgi:hypothetical protein